MVLGCQGLKFGHFEALETPSGDLGLQGSILGPFTSRKTSFRGYLLSLFLHFLGYFSDVIFDVKTVGQKVFQKCRMDDILEQKME